MDDPRARAAEIATKCFRTFDHTPEQIAEMIYQAMIEYSGEQTALARLADVQRRHDLLGDPRKCVGTTVME